MASDTASMQTNGTHSGHASKQETSQNGYTNYNAEQSANMNQGLSSSAPASEVPKDEVGWYFVEQYYTTLSKNPEKLCLFYNKRSQFVIGDEADKIEVCIGQKTSSERIKTLDFYQCKVRVTNVDSQASDSNIVIQVIGEMSNKSKPHKKFVQTFVLAVQTNGYFVLNDIFRYLVDEEEAAGGEVGNAEENTDDAAAHKVEIEMEGLTSSQDPQAVEESAELLDRELEAKVDSSDFEDPSLSTKSVSESQKQQVTSKDPAPKQLSSEQPSKEAGRSPSLTTLDVEKPQDPAPTPVTSPLKPVSQPASIQQTTEEKRAPAAPTSWASLAAAANKNKTSTATAPQDKPASVTQNAASKSTNASAAATTTAPVATSTPAVQESGKLAGDSASSPMTPTDGWTNVAGKGQPYNQRPFTPYSPTETPEQLAKGAFIKNIPSDVDESELRSVLEQRAGGSITALTINRPKNCAWVDFDTAEACSRLKSNKEKTDALKLGDVTLQIEERRAKGPRLPERAGPAKGPQRGGFGPNGQANGRDHFNNNQRGNFGGRGRGGPGYAGSGAPRGRGTPA